MNYFQLYLHYIVKIAFLTKIIFTKPAGIVCLIPSMVTVFLTPAFSISKFTPTQWVLILLFWFFILDFITGIYASWIEKKKRKMENMDDNQNLITSEKLRRCGVKASVYCTGTLSVYGVEKIFFIKSVRFESVSEQGFTITMLIVAVFCGCEFYSIFFENFKRAGYDIVARVQKIKSVKKKLSE